LKSKILEERVRRVKVLFKELGYRLTRDDKSPEEYTAAISNSAGVVGGVFLDTESRFLELGYTFSFSSSLSHYLRNRLEDVLRVCYEFGCYPNVQKDGGEIAISLFSKIYFSGLNYFSLKDSLKDFRACVDLVTGVLDIHTTGDEEEEESL
jgi:hypothetical protein